MDFSNYLEAFQEISKGIPTTIIVTVFGIIVSFFIALLITIVRFNCKNRFALGTVNAYVVFFSGTPLLFQYFIFYYSPAQFEVLHGTLFFEVISNPYFVAILVTGLNSGAYTSMIFQGAMQNIDKGQWDCCKSMGLSRWQTFKLLFPYALRRVLPAYSNEVILAFKGTSLVAMITLLDVFGYARLYYNRSYDGITAFVSAGIIYLVISLMFTVILRIIEKNWLKHAV